MWIERYEPRWHTHVIELANTVFGEGYFSEPGLHARQPDSIMVVAHDGGSTLHGFAHGRILAKGSLGEYLGPEVTDIPESVRAADAAGNLGVIDVVAVSPDHRRQGIGLALLRAMHDALIGAGADKLLVTFKRGPMAVRVDGIMHTLGFDLWRKLPSYWRDKCNRGEFKCADRTDRCVCEAMLFRKSIY
jgi:GNAT superfamily N-acetyltransferase